MPVPLLIAFFSLLGLGLVYPLLPFMALELGLAPGLVPLVLMVDTLATVALAPLWGGLSDRFGRRVVLVPVLLSGPASFLLLGFADSLASLFAARALLGVAYAAMPVIQAHLADRTSTKGRLSAMAGVNFMFALAFVVGPLLVHLSMSFELGGQRAVVFLAAAVSAMAPLMAFLFLAKPAADAGSNTKPESSALPGSRFAAWHRARSPIAVIFIVGFAYAAMDTTIGVWSVAALGWGPGEYSLIFVAGGAAAMVSQLCLVAKPQGLPGERLMAELGIAALSAGLVTLVINPGSGWVYAASCLMGAGTATALSCLQSMVSGQTAASDQGQVLGCAQSSFSLAFILGPLWGGFAFSQLGPDIPFVSGCLLLILPLAIFWRMVRRDAAAPSAPLPQRRENSRTTELGAQEC